MNHVKKQKRGVAKIFDALMASIILIAVVSVASFHIIRTNHLSSDSELELAASSIDQVIRDYERTGLIYYYVNNTDLQGLYENLFRTMGDDINSVQLNITLMEIDASSSEYTVIASIGHPLKDYVELSYFLTVPGSSEDHFYVLKVRIGYGEG